MRTAGQASQVRSLRADTRVDQTDPNGRIKGRVMMFIERPNRVRFDAMTSFGPLAVLTSDGDAFALTEMKDKRFTHGESCPENIARMLGVELSAAEVVGLLLGEIPSFADAAPAEPVGCAKDGGLRVRQQTGQAGQVLIATFQPEDDGGRLAGLALLEADGTPLWSVQYDGYERVGDGRQSLPSTVRLHDQRRDSHLVIRFKSREVNVKVPDGVFTQKPRPGLLQQEVACD